MRAWTQTVFVAGFAVAFFGQAIFAALNSPQPEWAAYLQVLPLPSLDSSGHVLTLTLPDTFSPCLFRTRSRLVSRTRSLRRSPALQPCILHHTGVDMLPCLHARPIGNLVSPFLSLARALTASASAPLRLRRTGGLR